MTGGNQDVGVQIAKELGGRGFFVLVPSHDLGRAEDAVLEIAVGTIESQL